MTDRREFLGAVAALFCGVTLPAPVVERIWVSHDPFMYHLTTTIKLSEILVGAREEESYRNFEWALGLKT